MTYSITDSCSHNPTGDLRTFATQGGLVLFGAGKNGEYASHYLNYIGADILCFVDNASQNIGHRINGIEVRSTNSLTANQSQRIVITSERYADAIMAQLVAEGFTRQQVYVLRQSELQRIYDNDAGWPDYAIVHHTIPFFRDYLVRHQFDPEASVLRRGELVFPNPLNAQLPYQKSFFAAYMDYVLPTLCDDYTMIVEGPGEYGQINVNSGDVVLDCGANVGLFSIIAASKGATVHAFEPMKDILPHLVEAAEYYPTITPWEAAVSNENGTVEMHFPGDGPGTASSFVLNAGCKTAKVETVTVDDFLRSNGINRCDFIKADIEGAERLMLQGAQETLRTCAPKLSICTYHLPDDKKVLEQLIKSANPDYIVDHHWQKLYAYVPNRLQR
jgi:FkbM family methyltransferase